MNSNTSTLLQTLRQSNREFDSIEKRLYDIEQKYKQLYCREVFHYNSKIYLKDPNNTIYSISNPSKKLGIYINKVITFCNMDEELSEECYDSI
jgi:hypothetical protein